MPGPIIHATRADLDEVAAMLSRAFLDDPVERWIWRSLDDPRPAQDEFFRFFTHEYFALGHLYVAPANRGAALWAPPDRATLQGDRLTEFLELMGDLLGEQAGPVMGELSRVTDYFPEEPHFYLGIAGVDPAAQSGGIGGALLRPVLAACDEGGFVAHLESSNPRNIGFYERHGFRPVGEFTLGGPTGPQMTPMRRDPVR